jgi:hypothetical protein
MPRTIYLFGIELELLLSPRNATTTKGWEDVTNDLNQLMRRHNIPNELYDETRDPDYTQWTIAPDDSIIQDRQTQKWGVELISNICYNIKKSTWELIQHTLWTCVQSNFNIVPSISCGTHVHVSLKRSVG